MTRPRKRVFGPLFYTTAVVAVLALAYTGVMTHGPELWRRIDERRTVRSLAEGLRSADLMSREGCAKGLIRIGPAVAVPALLRAARDPSGDVRATACKWLVEAGGDPIAVVPGLIVAAGDGLEEVRVEAAQALGRVTVDAATVARGSPGIGAGLSAGLRAEILQALRRLVKDPAAPARAAAADAIGELEADPESADLVDRPGRGDPSPSSFPARSWRPARVPTPDGRAAVADLAAATLDDDRAVRFASARALLKVNGAGDPAAARTLAALVADPEPVADRRAALDLLKIAGGDAYDRAIIAVAGLLPRGDFSIRHDLIDCLEAAGPRALVALPALQALSTEEDSTHRGKAGMAIVAILGPKDPRALAALARTVADPTLPLGSRMDALDTIREADPTALAKLTPPLIRQLGAARPNVRHAAIELLIQIVEDTPAELPGPAGAR